MKNEIPVPLTIGAIVVVLGLALFLMYRMSVPQRPAGARPAAEGIRADIAKLKGIPANSGYLHNPKKD